MDYRMCPLGEIVSITDEQHQLVIRGSLYTSVGMVRGNNEDNVQLWALDNALLGVVADGMGGAAAGEEASRLAIETFQSDFLDTLPDSKTLLTLEEETLEQKLRGVMGMANRVLLNKANENQEFQGMGTTATLVLVRGNAATFAHIGDSRAYLIDGTTDDIHQVTSDHSFVEALVASGHLTKEQAEIHPLKNVLYRALGQKDEAEEDVDIYQRILKPGDRLILCSDGLTRHLKNQDIADIATTTSHPETAAEKLVELANLRGGEDNVSVVVLMVDRL